MELQEHKVFGTVLFYDMNLNTVECLSCTSSDICSVECWVAWFLFLGLLKFSVTTALFGT